MRVRTLALLLSFAVLAPEARAEDSPARLLELGRFRAARAAIEPRVKANPNDAEAQWLWSQIEDVYGHDESALAAAEKAVSLAPDHAAYHTQLAMVAGSLAERAGPLKGIGLGKRFKKEAEAALALDPRQWDAREGLLLFYLKAPGIIGGDKKKALALLEETSKLDAEQGAILRARHALATNDTNGVEGHWRAAIAAAPHSYRARMSLASWYGAKKRYAESEQVAREALAADPGRGSAYVLLAQLYARDGRYEAIDALLAQAARERPGDLAAQYQAARVIVTGNGSGDFARAERWLKGYLAAEPEPGGASHAGAHWRLGQIYEKQGKKAEARAEYEQAVKLDPKLEEAKKDLQRIRKG